MPVTGTGEQVKYIQPIESLETFKARASQEIIASGNKLMAENHDSGPNKKEYHTSEHPKTLFYRADRMAAILGIRKDPARQALTNMVISYHDTIIDVNDPPEYDKSKPDSIVGMVTRKRGAREGDSAVGASGNEAKSAELLIEAMKEKNKEAGQYIFSDNEIKTAKLAVDVTFPGVEGGPNFAGVQFKDDPFYKKIVEKNSSLGKKINDLEKPPVSIVRGIKFFQPHLETLLEKHEKVPEEVLIMAMTDLGGSGIASAEQFAKEGDAEFREIHPNIGKNLEKLSSDPEMTAERATVVRKMEKWLDDQISFVVWQALRFEKITLLLKERGQLDENKEKELRKFFGNYESNIEASLKRAGDIKKNIESMNEQQAFDYLIVKMHYVKESRGQIVN